MADLEAVLPSPVEVELYYFDVRANNTFRIGVRLDDGSCLYVDLLPGSHAHERILDLLTDVASEQLQARVGSGVAIVGMTPPEEESEAE